MVIKKVKLGEILPYYNNPRDNANAVKPVIESIKRYGFVKPLLLDKEGVIIVGHTRYVAAYQMGLEYVPVIYSDMPEEQAKEFRIVDNKIAEKSIFDDTALAEELKKLAVPEGMQAFFFEDINTLINFSFEDFNVPEVSTDFGVGAGYEEANDYQEEPQEDTNSGCSSYDEFEVTEDDAEEIHEEDETDGLFKIRYVDGKKVMKVICPYCGNVEVVEI